MKLLADQSLKLTQECTAGAPHAAETLLLFLFRAPPSAARTGQGTGVDTCGKKSADNRMAGGGFNSVTVCPPDLVLPHIIHFLRTHLQTLMSVRVKKGKVYLHHCVQGSQGP